MNIISAAGCRIYQAAFRAVLPLLPYRQPVLYGSVEAAVNMLHERGVSSVLLVTDKGLRACGITAGLEQQLDRIGIGCAVYDGTSANPTSDNVEQAVRMYAEHRCEAIIAFGGGSPMDCAKAVGARIAYPHRSLDRLKGLLRVLRPIPVLVAIPTTAGTGSEVTITAVITDSVTHHKYTMNSFTLIPSHAVHDASLTCSLPPHLTASTGMDALTHAVEAYIGRSTTRYTRRLSLDAVRLVFANIETACLNGKDTDARQNMLRASYMAGIAFSMSYVGYIHAVAHSLGGRYNTPHGLANAVLMPIVLREYGSAVYTKLHRLAVAAGVADKHDTHREGAEKFISAICELNRRMGIPETLPEIQECDIPAMAKHAAREANPLYPVPKLMNAAELERLYRLAVGQAE